jgi:hypothetical protein
MDERNPFFILSHYIRKIPAIPDRFRTKPEQEQGQAMLRPLKAPASDAGMETCKVLLTT